MLDMINTRIIGLADYRISAGEPGVVKARYLTSASAWALVWLRRTPEALRA
jgi:hypothetical protein